MPDQSIFDLLPLIQQAISSAQPANRSPQPVAEKPFDPGASGKFSEYLMNAQVPQNLAAQPFLGQNDQPIGTLFSAGQPQPGNSMSGTGVGGAGDLGVMTGPNIGERDQGTIQALINAFREKQQQAQAANSLPEIDLTGNQT